MAGGGGPHNKSPRRGSGLLGGGVGVVFADWNAPALEGILDQQGVVNVGNSTMYQLRTNWLPLFVIEIRLARWQQWWPKRHSLLPAASQMIQTKLNHSNEQ